MEQQALNSLEEGLVENRINCARLLKGIISTLVTFFNNFGLFGLAFTVGYFGFGEFCFY
jgi:hypothetical protein